MWFVYILKNLNEEYLYVGSTNNVNRRLIEHNSGDVKSTKPYIPLKPSAYITVENEFRARNLEKYFKTGLGIACARKRILTYEALAK